MAETSGKQYGVGLRYGVVFELNSSGLPNASAATAYTGLDFCHPKAFTLTIPQPRKITHTGDDRVLAVDFLPSLEAPSAELTVAQTNYGVISLLSGITVTTVGEAKEIAYATSKQGFEPLVGLLLYQQSLDSESGLRRWRSFIIPKARCIPIPGGMADTPQDMKFSIAPMIVTARLWGQALSVSVDGYTDAGIFEYMTEGKPKMVAFKGDGTTTVFSFPTDAQALNTSKIAVFKNGTAVSSGITKAVGSLTFSTAPTSSDDIDVFYETA